MNAFETDIELLIKHEKAIGRLFETYAIKFPDHKQFWATLAWEEQDHAKNIRKLAQLIKKRHVRFDSEKFKPIAIKTSIEYIEKEITRANKEDISLKTALSVAINIEKAIIDGEIFDAFKGYSTEAKSFLRKCASDFAEHYRSVEEMWLAHRKFS